MTSFFAMNSVRTNKPPLWYWIGIGLAVAGLLLLELVVSVPLWSLLLFWRIVAQLRLEQQIILVVMTTLVIAVTYSLTITMVLILVSSGLIIDRIQSRSSLRSENGILFLALITAILLTFMAGINQTGVFFLGSAISLGGCLVTVGALPVSLRRRLLTF